RFLPCNGSISPTIMSRWRSVSIAENSIDPRANARHETSPYRRRHETRFENGENRVGRQIPRRGYFHRQSGPRHLGANTWRGIIAPRLKTIQLDWATFQIMRRSHASLSRQAGIDPKLVADQLGHGLGVNLAVYTVAALDQRQHAVQALETTLIRT